MTTRIWSKVDDKWATILVLRDHEVHCLHLNGFALTLKRKVQGIVDSIEQGQSPLEVGVKSVETLDARTIARAELSPGHDSLTLHPEEPGGKKISYSPGGKTADEILQAILAQSGRNFQPTQVEVGVFEALLPPGVVGVVGGVILAALYQAAGKLARGEEIEIKGGRRRGLQRLMVTAAETLGTNGTLGLGVALLVLVIGWAALRIVKRPHRTVWLAETS